MKRILWTDDFNLEDYEEIFSDMEENMGRKLSDDEKYEAAYDQNYLEFEDLMVNMDIRLPGEVIEIGTIGRWNGRFNGYKEHHTHVLKNVFTPNVDGMSYNEWYVDRYNLHHKESHHDGTNYTFYRMFRPELTEYQKAMFETALYEGKCSDRMLRRYTVSVKPYISNIFGWRI